MLRNLYQQLDIQVDLFKKTKSKKYLDEVRILQNQITKIATTDELDIQEKDLYKTYTENELRVYLDTIGKTAGPLAVSN